MKFITDLVERCKNYRKKQARIDLPVIGKESTKSPNKDSYHIKKSASVHTKSIKELPKWVEMKCNALIYLRQTMKLKSEHERDIKVRFRSKSQDKSDDGSEDSIHDKLTMIEDINSSITPVQPNIQSAQEAASKENLKIDELNEDNKNEQSDEDNDLCELASLKTLSMICPICHLFMYKTSCVSCSHMFCNYCIDEYMLFKSTCPICEKTIRDGKITRCTIADSAIEKILDTSSKKNYDQWITKKFRNDLYYQSKKIYPQDINSHTISQSKINVDVRDSEYVWCEARIVAIIEAKDQENSILVHFKGWDLKYDEIIPVSSPRLARLGFYTNRKDIPYYMETPNKIKKPIIGIHEGNYKIIDELKRQIYNEEFKKNKKNLLDSDEDAPNNIDEHYEYLKEKCMSVIHHYARRNTGTPNTSFNANDLRLRSGASYVYLTSGLNSNNFRIRIPTFDSRRMIQNWNR